MCKGELRIISPASGSERRTFGDRSAIDLSLLAEDQARSLAPFWESGASFFVGPDVGREVLIFDLNDRRTWLLFVLTMVCSRTVMM